MARSFRLVELEQSASRTLSRLFRPNLREHTERIHGPAVCPQLISAGSEQRKLVQHACARLLQRLSAVLPSSRVIVVEEQSADERVEQPLVLEQDLLVCIRNGDSGNATDERECT